MVVVSSTLGGEINRRRRRRRCVESSVIYLSLVGQVNESAGRNDGVSARARAGGSVQRKYQKAVGTYRRRREAISQQGAESSFSNKAPLVEECDII